MTRAISALNKKKSLPKNILLLSVVILIGAIVVAGINQLPHTEARRVVTIFIGNDLLEVNTDKTLVADILAEASITLDANYQKPIPALDEEPEAGYIVIIEAPKVVLKVDGQELELLSFAESVGDLLAEQNIFVDDDIVNFSLEDGLFPGQRVEVVRVTRELVYEELVIAAKTTYRNDSSIVLGKQEVRTQAKDGKNKLIYEVIYHDGIEVSRSKVGEEVIAAPVAGLILRGTQPVASRGGSSSSGVVEGIASWYGGRFHGRLTASGVPYDMHAMTAAHLTLKFGTRVRVTYLKTGKSVVVEINDRGPHIAGRIIDLSAAAAKEIGLQADGIGKVKVEILK